MCSRKDLNLSLLKNKSNLKNSGCNSKFSTRYKLGEHVRTHTKEKTIGCPTCGTLFSNKTKFCDHRRRQLSTDCK